MKKMSRRGLMGAGLGLAGVAVSRAALGAVACGVQTPAQTEGPFYPVNDQADKDNDLTWVRGKTEPAAGEVVIVTGQVVDENCQPVKDALVEIWQAAHTGKYNHPGDPNPAPLDPNFQYWGRDLTDDNGMYSFRTIIPGEYAATDNWTRPPHIHFKIHRRGFQELTTQMYFAGHRLNAADRILRALTPEEQKRVSVKFVPDGNAGAPVGRFDIVLRNVPA